MKIAMYLRFSKKSQATQTALASHLYQLGLVIDKLGGQKGPLFSNISDWVENYWDIDNIPYQELHSNNIFIDLKSGFKDVKRGDFETVLNLVEQNKIDVLVVRQDRLSRNLDKTSNIASLFEKSGARLYEMLKERYLDFNNPDDWADFTVAGVYSERESRTNSKRIKFQKQHGKSQGKIIGTVPFGFRKNLLGKPEIDPAKETAARRMVAIFFECGRSPTVAVRQIKAELGISRSVPGFISWLQNPVLRGGVGYDTLDENGNKQPPETIIWGTHEPLLTEDEIRKIDTVLVDQKKPYRPRKFNDFPLTGLLFCGRCNSPCRVIRTTDAKYGYQYCNIYCRAHESGSGCGGDIQGIGKLYGKKQNGRYHKLGTAYNLAEAAVIQSLKERAVELAKKGIKVKPQIEEPPEVIQARQEVRKYEKLSKEDPDLIQVYEIKKEKLNNLLNQQGSDDQPALDILRKKLVELSKTKGWEDFWSLASNEEKRSLFEDFVEAVFVDRLDISVSLKI